MNTFRQDVCCCMRIFLSICTWAGEHSWLFVFPFFWQARLLSYRVTWAIQKPKLSHFVCSNVLNKQERKANRTVYFVLSAAGCSPGLVHICIKTYSTWFIFGNLLLKRNTTSGGRAAAAGDRRTIKIYYRYSCRYLFTAVQHKMQPIHSTRFHAH